MEIGLSLGSNLGDRLANLREARRLIHSVPGVSPVACAPVYETEPVDVPPRYAALAFLNTVLVVEHNDPVGLAAAAHGIEDRMGRRRSDDRNAPRVIDIDVIYSDGISLNEPGLVVPHPRWMERRFVVQPLADVRPELVLPGTDLTVRGLLLTLPAEPKVFVIAPEW